jgi:hypothetical protein
MDDWHDFLVAAAGAGAALAGLVFVGLSINLEMIMSTFGLPGRALEALVMLMAVLVVCCSLLVPAKGMVLAGVEVLPVGVVDWAIIVAIQLRQLRNSQSLEPDLRWTFVCSVVLGQAATLPFVASGLPY